ncbi:MAG: PIN domain-containing protein [Spirosomataceae bacterium]
MIFDTSVWIAFFRNVRNEQTDLLDLYLQTGDLYMLGVLVQEILQGIRHDNQYEEISSILTSLPFLNQSTLYFHVAAAQLYRQLRKKGITIRKPNDCLIATYAVYFDLELCHNDTDFDLIAEHTALKIWTPS